MLVLHLGERIEARLLGERMGIAGDASASSVHVGESVERHGVAEELPLPEDARARARIAWVEAQLDALAHQLGAHLEEAALPAHGAVLAHGAHLAVEEDLVEIGAAGDGAQLVGLREEVLARGAFGRVVEARVVLGAEPGPVLGVELGDRQRGLGQLVADLLAPGAVPALDDALGLGVPGPGVHELDPELGADDPERLGDVGRPAVDVVGARQAVLEDRLLEAVLLRARVLALGEAK